MKKVLSMLLVLMMVTALFAGCGKEEKNTAGNETNAGSEDASTDSSSTDSTESTDSGSSADEIVLRVAWWGNQVRDARTEEALALYTEMYPNVTFELEPIGWAGYWDKLATQTAGGSLPDIIQQDYAFIGQYIDKGVLADLSPYVESGVLNLDDVAPANLEGGSADGGLYGVPLGMNALSYVYNKSLMDQMGYGSVDPNWTWNDFETLISDAYNEHGIRSDAPLWDDPKFFLENLLRQNDKNIYNEDGNGLGFETTDELVRMFTILADNTEAGVFPDPQEIAQKTTLEESLFVNNETLGGFIWSNFFVAYADLMDSELELTVMPNDEDGNSGLYLKPSQFFSVTESSEHKEEAARVIDFFTNSVEANEVLLAERGVPIAAAVRDGIKDSVSTEVAATFDYIALAENYATPISAPEPAGAAEVTKALKSIYEEVAYGVTTPEEGAERFMQEANSILSAN
jgi:multiple sugar transport system substrate-binding protein